MTDNELKELVGSLAIDSKAIHAAQKKTDKQIKELHEAQKKTDEQMKCTDEQMKCTDEKMKCTDEKIKELHEAQKKTDEQMKRTDKKLESIGIQLGDMSKNQGDVAEEFFLNSLINDNRLGEIHFDDITKNMQKHRGATQEEYDLVMTNSEAVGIVEVKYKIHENDLDKLKRKMRNFKKLFPIYNDYKLYGAIASFHINDDAKRKALERGFFVLKRRGTVVHTDCSDNLMVL